MATQPMKNPAVGDACRRAAERQAYDGQDRHSAEGTTAFGLVVLLGGAACSIRRGALADCAGSGQSENGPQMWAASYHRALLLEPLENTVRWLINVATTEGQAPRGPMKKE